MPVAGTESGPEFSLMKDGDTLHQPSLFLSFLFKLAFLCFLLAGCDSAPSQYRIEILAGNPGFQDIVAGLKEGMSDLGYVEGKDVSYVLNDFSASSDPAREIREKALDFGDADLIFSLFTEVSLVAKEAATLTGKPVVFAYAAVEDTGLVESVREPGGMITGIRYPGPEQIKRRLEILHSIAPDRTRISIVHVLDYPTMPPVLNALRPLAQSLGVTLVEVEVGGLEDLEKVLQARSRLSDPGMDAILLMPDKVNLSHDDWTMIRDFAAEHDLPIAGSFLHTAEQGALFGNANDLVEVGRLAASLIHKILQGIPAGTIPVVSPEPELYVNYRRARELGLEIPEGLLRQAAVIVQ